MEQDVRLGATVLGAARCRFTVWAPRAQRAEVHILGPQERLAPLSPGERGYHTGVLENVEPGTPYLYRLDGAIERPDPASRFQPRGAHGPSAVVDLHAFAWGDAGWRGIALEECIFYELHIGTYTPEGTFDAIIPRLDELGGLGVTAIELMPVAQFVGDRNWGYDGVRPHAVQNSYGGPEGLQRLVDACHRRGLAVALDVVYNHIGPEGNHLADFGPYFSDRYRTPWGPAMNFDGPHSDEVRRFFIENALDWITEFHIDALRLDALHAICDLSARPFLEELAIAVHERASDLGRRVHLIAENERNDSRFLRPRELGGCGLDAQWNDDFHHALHALLTGARVGYYQDFGELAHLATAWREGYVYSGQYSRYRRRRHGNSARDLPAHQFVVFSQNHDQVGNRPHGERLSTLVSFEALKLAAGSVLLSPFVPLLFMGEEYAAPAPFHYFVSHADPTVIEAVRRGRREEFAGFGWEETEVPDPQAQETFLRSRLDQARERGGRHRVLREFYRELIRLRKTVPALASLSKERMQVTTSESEDGLLCARRWAEGSEVFAAFHFGADHATVRLTLPAGTWHKRLDSAEERWLGTGSALPVSLESEGELEVRFSRQSVALFERAR
ncbi:MAG: malto-oligosyltrehalose trehalohydrolase [Gemmatimonadetes bacterium]|nr:malto-oligosyltrehalose trehalohydrolase [Gemmatimonadota bacterium]